MVNYFASLDSDDEDYTPEVEVKKAAPAKDVSKTTTKSTKSMKNNRNGDRNTKKGRGGPGPARDGKRQFDRRSGTGRGKEIKKGGGGSRNWGSDKNEAKKAEKLSAEDAAANADDNNASDVKNTADGTVVDDPIVEEKPEPVTYSFDEYLAEKAKIQSESELFAPKEEKKIDDEFSGKALAKSEDGDYLNFGGGKKLRKKNKEKKEVETLLPGFRVAKPENNDDRKDRGRRGDRRSGGRGDRKGGRDRKKASQSKNVDVSDTDAFPSL